MKCRAVRRRLSAYLDADVPADQRAAIAAHLEACAPCRAEAAALERAERALSTLARIEPAPELTADLRRRLAARPARRLRWGWAGAGFAAAAAAMLLLWLCARTPVAPPQLPPVQVTEESAPIEPPAAAVVAPATKEPAPPPPRPVRGHVARRPAPTRPAPEAAPPETAVAEAPAPEPTPAEDEQGLWGVILLVGPPQPAARSSGYYLEVTLPDGSKSVTEQAVERDAAGELSAIHIACQELPPESPGANQGG